MYYSMREQKRKILFYCHVIHPLFKRPNYKKKLKANENLQEIKEKKIN